MTHTARGCPWLAASLALAALLGNPGPAVARGQETPPSPAPAVIAEVRVHGNHAMADEQVLALAGIAEGDELSAGGEQQLQERLLRSGRFASAQVLVRYRSLDLQGPVVLVVSVQEKESVAAKLLLLPEIRYREEVGASYGGRVSARDLLGGGEFLSIPLTWGGMRRAAIEARKDWASGFSLGGYAQVRRWENPHFERVDRRAGGGLFLERRFADRFTLRARGFREQVSFGDLDESLGGVGVGARFDTRPDLAFAYDAVFLAADLDRLISETDVADVIRARFEAAAYRTLVGPAVLAVRAWVQLSDGSLPSYERLLVGGMGSLRGWRAGAFSGDSAALTAVELRVPLTSPLGAGRAGVALFWDTASVWDHGGAYRDAERHHGVGVGLFAMLPAVRLNLDVASNLLGEIRVHFGTGFRF